MASSKSHIYWNSPDLIELRNQILLDHPYLRTKTDITKLSDLAYDFDDILIEAIEKRPYIDLPLKEEIRKKYDNGTPILSIRSIKRLYGEDKSHKSMFEITTLDFFAIVGGYNSWDDFLNTKYNPNGKYFNLEKAATSNMEINTLHIIGWYPNMYVKLMYLGDCKFRAIDSTNYGSFPEDKIILADKFGFENVEVYSDNVECQGYPLYPTIFYYYKGEKRGFKFTNLSE